MGNNFDAIIIGAGVVGAATGYYLTELNLKVAIIEKDYPTAGSTSRCIGGVRQQFAHKPTIQLMIQSVKLLTQYQNDLKWDIEWYQGGYLFLAHSEEKKESYLKAMSIQREFNLPVSFLSPEECQKIVPGLNLEGLLGGVFCPTDGQVNPFKLTFNYLKEIERKKGKIYNFQKVVKIEVKKSKVIGLKTDKNEYFSSPIIINCAGPYAKEIGKLVNLDIPVEPERHEAIVTEKIEPLFPCMIVDYREDGCYFVQKYKTGNIVGCYTPIPNIPGYSLTSSFEFFIEMSRRMARLIPKLKEIRIIRQWAGSYEMTPDGNPIVGETSVEGFYLNCGMCGHGLMFAPAIGRALAYYIVKKESLLPLEDFSLFRDFSKKEIMK